MICSYHFSESMEIVQVLLEGGANMHSKAKYMEGGILSPYGEHNHSNVD